METKEKKIRDKKIVAKQPKAAEPKRMSKTWEAFLKYKGKGMIEILDMKAVLK